MNIRDAEEQEIVHLANIWYQGWLDAHEQIVPLELKRIRTRESFGPRLQQLIKSVRVVGPLGAPVGFHIVKDDELYQLYVSAEARGSGVAAALIADAEAKLAERGVETAWLACAIGNDRAARFYEKCGWRRVGNMINHLETESEVFDLEVWRYEKSPPQSAKRFNY
jgi:GNAT superfamily N-acetyltransferase